MESSQSLPSLQSLPSSQSLGELRSSGNQENSNNMGPQPEFELNEQTQAAIKSDFKVRRLFTTKNGREMLESEEVCEAPQCLFGHLWHEGETALMFGERSVGKSVLAVQIADSITRSGCFSNISFTEISRRPPGYDV